MTLFGRLTVVSVIVALIVGTAAGVVVSDMMRQQMQNELVWRATTIADGIARHVLAHGTSQDEDTAREELRSWIAASEDLLFAYVVNGDGEMTVHSFDGAPPEDLLRRLGPPLAVEEPTSPRMRMRGGGNSAPRRMAVAGRSVLLVGNSQAGGLSGRVYVGVDESRVHTQATIVKRQVIGTAIAIVGLASLLMALVGRRITAPMQQLANAMRAYGRGESPQLAVPEGSGSDIDQLVAAFNAMTAERRQAEEELRASEERFARVFAESPIGIDIYDADGLLVESNAACMATFGVEDISLIRGTSIAESPYADETKIGDLQQRGMVRYRTDVDLDELAKRAAFTPTQSGHVVLSVMLTPLGPTLVDGRPAGYLAQVQDNTRANKARLELERARDELEQYLDTVGVMILVLAPDGTVELINPLGCEILGRSEEEILGRNWFEEFLPERVTEEVRELFRSILAGEQGETCRGEGWVLVADGSERRMTWRNALLRDADGAIVGTLSSGEDITEHRRAEEQLAQSEERFRTLVETMSDGMVMLDREGLVTYSNPAAGKMFGYVDGIQPGSQMRDFLTPESQSIFEEHFRLRMEEGVGESYELSITATSGREVPVIITSTPLRNEQGEVVGSFAVVRDITEQEAALSALRESEERHRRLADSLPQIIFEADVNGGLTFTNDYARELLGYGAEAGSPSAMLDMIAPEDRPRAADHLQRLLSGEEVGPTEYGLLTRDGRIFPAVMHSSVIKQGEMIAGLRGVIFDITQLKQAEEEIRQLNQFRENVIDNANEWLTVVDQAGKVLIWNRAAEEISGYSSEEMLGEGNIWRKLYAEDAWREVSRVVEATFRDEETGQHETRLIRKSGEERIIEWRGRALPDANGRAIAMITLGRDVTDARELQRQLEQAQSMDAVGRLAGGIAHDFNNMLGAIIGHVDLLLRNLPPGSANRRSAEQIDSAAQQASELTRQLLAFSRQEQEMARAVVMNINDTVTGLRALIGPLLKGKIDLVDALAPDLGSVLADPGQMQQVLMNLIINARDAMPEGGRLSISTANVDVSGTRIAEQVQAADGQCVLLSVTDTGHGMTEEVRAHIFEPFFTTKPSAEGTGLGLATVYVIVQQAGGTIEVTSEPGAGTAFDIYLPRVAPAAGDADTRAADAAAADALHGSETVLVAEDDEVLRELCRVMLEEFGYTVLLAGNAQAALELAHNYEGGIDMLVADVVMPGMSGVQLGQELASVIPGLTVLYMSGYAGGVVMEGQPFDPGEAFVQKPFTPDALLSKMRQLLDEK